MSYIRNAWYVAAWADDIAPERPAGVRVLNDPIVVWRNAAGELAAFEDRCVHRLAPLSMGRCEGERLRCMYHGLLYDRTGRVVEIPGQDRISKNFRVRAYPVVERSSWIWIWMGAAAAADESLIPPAVGPNDSNYILGRGQLDFDVQAHLINDNLLDLSHVPFLHAQSAKVSEEVFARQRPKFTKGARSVHTEWWHRGAQLRSGELADIYTRSDFYVPGVLVVTDRGYPMGTADQLAGQEPSLERPPFHILSHLVSPMADRSSRYFYCVGCHRDFGDDAAPARDSLLLLAEKAFAEDKVMIKAQQQIMDSTPNWRVLPTSNDRGVALYNQILQKLARDEASELGLQSPPVSALT